MYGHHGIQRSSGGDSSLPPKCSWTLKCRGRWSESVEDQVMEATKRLEDQPQCSYACSEVLQSTAECASGEHKGGKHPPWQKRARSLSGDSKDLISPAQCSRSLEGVGDEVSMASFEEAEISDEVTDQQSARLFKSEVFPAMFPKVLRVLKLQKDQEQPTTDSSEKVWSAAEAFPAQQETPKGFPLPEHFGLLIDKQWKNPAKNKYSERPSTKQYTLTSNSLHGMLEAAGCRRTRSFTGIHICATCRFGGPAQGLSGQMH